MHYKTRVGQTLRVLNCDWEHTSVKRKPFGWKHTYRPRNPNIQPVTSWKVLSESELREIVLERIENEGKH